MGEIESVRFNGHRGIAALARVAVLAQIGHKLPCALEDSTRFLLCTTSTLQGA